MGKLKGERREEPLESQQNKETLSVGWENRGEAKAETNPVQMREDACATGIIDSAQVADFLWI